MIVLAIIGLSLIVPRVLNYLGESKVKAAKIQLQGFATALNHFYRDVGRYPSTSEGLDALVKPLPGLPVWNGPYLKDEGVPHDPWGKPYVYRSPGERGDYEIKSDGARGESDPLYLFD